MEYDHHNTYIGTYIEKYMQYYMCHMDTGENFCTATKHIIFVIRRTVLVPGVCLCIHIYAMMYHMDTGEAVVTSQKIDNFCLSPRGL